MDKGPKIIVRISKDYAYSISVLKKGREEEDAINKAYDDIYNDMQEVVKNNFQPLNAQFFDMSLVSEKKWRFRRKLEFDFNQIKKNTVHINQAANRLATQRITEQYGPLNPDLNPAIYDIVPDEKNSAERTVKLGYIALKQNIEQELINYISYYTGVLRDLKNGIPQPEEEAIMEAIGVNEEEGED